MIPTLGSPQIQWSLPPEYGLTVHLKVEYELVPAKLPTSLAIRPKIAAARSAKSRQGADGPFYHKGAAAKRLIFTHHIEVYCCHDIG